MSRPTVTVYTSEGARSGTAAMPAVFTAPIRNDIVHFVHSNIAKNRRQARGVKENAGHQTAAESWGTGRAVSRIPRVGGSGTHRSGQAAFGNMCRGGHMYSPLKTYRKWNTKVNQTQKRHATASALAASAVGPLLLARGHRLDVAEVPLVVDALAVEKTSSLIKALVALGLEDELRRVSDSKKIRTGRGKLRNRRYVIKRGPLIVHNDGEEAVARAARNIGGVDSANVHRLNLLQLAPGGNLGRLIVWTKSAFDALNSVFGSTKRESAEKNGYTLQRNIVNTADISRIINSDTIQNLIREPIDNEKKRHLRKKNPLRNKGVMHRLNPFARVRAEAERKQQEAAHAKRAAQKKAKRADKAAHKKSLAAHRDFTEKQEAAQVKALADWNAELEAQQIKSSSSEGGDSDDE